MRYETDQINNLTGENIMEISKLKNLQRYKTSFEINFRNFERQPQSEQLSIIFNPPMEEIYVILDTADIEMTPSHSMIEPIFNRNSSNTFQHHI